MKVTIADTSLLSNCLSNLISTSRYLADHSDRIALATSEKQVDKFSEEYWLKTQRLIEERKDEERERENLVAEREARREREGDVIVVLVCW